MKLGIESVGSGRILRIKKRLRHQGLAAQVRTTYKFQCGGARGWVKRHPNRAEGTGQDGVMMPRRSFRAAGLFEKPGVLSEMHARRLQCQGGNTSCWRLHAETI